MAIRRKPVIAVRGSLQTAKSKSGKTTLTSFAPPASKLDAAIPPSRLHEPSYHYPLLLSQHAACDALLEWFSGVEETRSMPWRKKWIDPTEYEDREEELGCILSKRAYEVWVSEVMLQQTRVSTVIPYFNNWISKWPTVQDLAQADHDDVLAVWKGLGYYSRATRLHEGAKAMIAKADGASCILPSSAKDLQEFPGIGRYTAGAISSIVFGEPEPVLDGNVIRVLSRQLGLYMDSKDKKATDILWSQADQIIKHVSSNSSSSTSSIPGQWNQALMELGSTICTPRPLCEKCPIQSTCRVYTEGQAIAATQKSPQSLPDIEDSCAICEPLDIEDLMLVQAEVAEKEEKEQSTKKRKTKTKQSNTLSNYFAIGNPKPKKETQSEENDTSPQIVNGKRKHGESESASDLKPVISYCALFPKKIAKKKAAEEECAVCMIEMCFSDGTSVWLIEQRPAKGLLASLWQFPQLALEGSDVSTSKRRALAEAYICTLSTDKSIDMSKAEYIAAFPPLVHIFTHIRLTMHAYHYRIAMGKAGPTNITRSKEPTGPVRKWVAPDAMENETLSTGMRKCWDLVAATS